MRRPAVAILFIVLLARTAAAQPESAPAGTLVVGTAPVPPFIIKGADGSWSGIAVVPRAKTGFFTAVRRIFSSQFLQIVLALVGILFVIGLLIWLAERRHNPAQFGGSPVRGIGAGFW
jgi:hypothetical protein